MFGSVFDVHKLSGRLTPPEVAAIRSEQWLPGVM